jgi:beta-lactamase class A
MHRKGLVRSSLLLLASASLLACGADASPPPAAPPPPPAPVASAPPAPVAPPAAPALPAGVPDSPAGRQLAWVLGGLASAPAPADAAAHFSAEFLAQVPPSKLVAVFGQFAQGAPWTLEKVTPSDPSSPKLLAVVRSASGPRFNVHLRVAKDGDRIEGLLFQPAVDVKVAASWDEVQATVRAVAPSVNLLAAEIDGKKCAPLASLDPNKPLALGSAFKLYILDALASQIAAGKHGWDEPVTIQDAYKSLPSGDMRDEPAGKAFSLRHFAEQMISVSDNTATDHLLAFVGRGAVEDAVKASGHAAPLRLQPFMSTREMFALKLLASPEERSAYVAADVAHKRRLLEAFDRRDPSDMMARAGSFTRPIMIDSIEWPASPEDLCKVMAGLKGRADAAATAPVGSILSINPGIPDDRKQYSYLGYKGGSEPGVLNMTWLLQRARDQKWLFLTVGFNDTSNQLDESKAIAAAATAREFLGR